MFAVRPPAPGEDGQQMSEEVRLVTSLFGGNLENLIEPSERRVSGVCGGQVGPEASSLEQLLWCDLPPDAGRGQPLYRGHG